MKQWVKQWRKVCDRVNQWQHYVLALMVTSVFSSPVMAGLPDWGDKAATKGPIKVAKDFGTEVLTYLVLAVSVSGMVWVGWAAIAKFNEARNGKAEWGEVGLLGIVAAAMLMIVGYILKVAGDVFGVAAGK